MFTGRLHLTERLIFTVGLEHWIITKTLPAPRRPDEDTVRPSFERSYERLCHQADYDAFFLPLRQPLREELREELVELRLERAIGVEERASAAAAKRRTWADS